MLKTIPGVGAVTIDVLVSELGDVTRFRNAKAVCAYAGLVPVVRQSGGKKSKELRNEQRGFGPAPLGLGRVGLADHLHQ